jgi:hypothetical protein
MSSRAVTLGLPLACLAYAAVALGGRRSLVAAVAATLVAGLLWRRHRRARFAAYVFFSALAIRAAATAAWPALAFAVAAVLVMQTPPARVAWPRLRPGWPPRRGDRMRSSS